MMLDLVEQVPFDGNQQKPWSSPSTGWNGNIYIRIEKVWSNWYAENKNQKKQVRTRTSVYLWSVCRVLENVEESQNISISRN